MKVIEATKGLHTWKLETTCDHCNTVYEANIDDVRLEYEPYLVCPVCQYVRPLDVFEEFPFVGYLEAKAGLPGRIRRNAAAIFYLVANAVVFSALIYGLLQYQSGR